MRSMSIPVTFSSNQSIRDLPGVVLSLEYDLFATPKIDLQCSGYGHVKISCSSGSSCHLMR